MAYKLVILIQVTSAIQKLMMDTLIDGSKEDSLQA